MKIRKDENEDTLELHSTWKNSNYTYDDITLGKAVGISISAEGADDSFKAIDAEGDVDIKGTITCDRLIERNNNLKEKLEFTESIIQQIYHITTYKLKDKEKIRLIRELVE